MASTNDSVAWQVRLSERLFRLKESLARDEGLELDFSPESLAGLEAFLTSSYEDTEDVRTDEDGEWIAEGAAAYVGELLLRSAGGHWGEEKDPAPWNVPPIHADQALALPPLAPLGLVLAAVGGEGVLRRQYAEWTEAVRAYQAGHPSWSPAKRWTPVVDPVPVEQSEHEYLANWLATQERAFPGWVQQYGMGITWDFSRASLEALGTLLLTCDVTNADFLNVAAWYAGETMRRVRGGVWKYRHGDPDASPYLGQPYLRQRSEDGAFGRPVLAIKISLRQNDFSHLLRQYDAYVS
ncbi:hypothetical protein EDC02_4689 [Micromonospora sp. Llam0]|uniref:hypothetical protein n=1 Tax=Micromonospora sp. Llam0 TaxID=2485143 RepID=UPI000F9FC259|nr:hypothetical protein [Micromonospora sp. Llam0]ROO62702.1 hypothetical protein EDC02_4689 [Micromonospora sp. Llam0]